MNFLTHFIVYILLLCFKNEKFLCFELNKENLENSCDLSLGLGLESVLPLECLSFCKKLKCKSIELDKASLVCKINYPDSNLVDYYRVVDLFIQFTYSNLIRKVFILKKKI